MVELLRSAGHEVTGVVRSEAAGRRLVEVGVRPALLDVVDASAAELDELLGANGGYDAAVWAAGAGAGDDPNQVDDRACRAMQGAADRAGVQRWVQISSLFADRPEQGPPFMQAVLKAKQASDAALAGTGLDWTVIRAGGLTDESGTGLVEVGTGLRPGTITRSDVALVVLGCLDEPATDRTGFDLVGGFTPVAKALACLRAT